MAIKFTFLSLNLAKIQIFIPKRSYGGGGSTGLGIIPKKKSFFTASLSIELNFFFLREQRWQAVNQIGWKRTGPKRNPPKRENEKQYDGNADVQCEKTGWYLLYTKTSGRKIF